MSEVSVGAVKKWLPVLHSGDDDMLQDLINAAEDWVLQFCDRRELPTLPADNPPAFDSDSSELPEEVPSSGDPIAPTIRMAILFQVKANYRASADDSAKFQAIAERLCGPFRARQGA
jgi:hypothetical protein